MRAVSYPGLGERGQLLVLLPGRSSAVEDYQRHGFISAAREAGLVAQIVAGDAHLGYYARRSFHVRLLEDVIRPARARGLSRPWMAGISLGGLGSIIMAREFPREVEGLIVIAPYLGPDDLAARIEKAGGLRHWQPAPRADDFEMLWSWLKAYADAPGTRPPLLLAFGEGDRFGRAHRLLAEVLPPDRVLREPGGHDWPTWQRLWARLVRHPLVSDALGSAAVAPSPGAARVETPGTR